MNKRVEIYIGFKCNNNCVFCVELKNRQKNQHLSVLQNEQEINDLLNQYRQQGYRHINLLGGEPFLEKNFYPILQAAKKLGFLVAVTTNGSMLADSLIAQTHLPLIDDLVVSIHSHNQELTTQQSNNPQLFSQLVKALPNINLFFKGRILKSNTVINKLNYKFLPEVVNFIVSHGIKEVSLTSMSIEDYNKDYSVRLRELTPLIDKIVASAKQDEVKVRLADLPFCVLGDNYYLANHLYFDQRKKFDVVGQQVVFDRQKYKNQQCQQCIHNELCQGVDRDYFKLFGDEELKAVKL